MPIDYEILLLKIKKEWFTASAQTCRDAPTATLAALQPARV